MKDGEAFGGEMKGSGTLHAQDEVPLESYAGTYQCYASNILGTAVTQTIEVIVERESHTDTYSLYMLNEMLIHAAEHVPPPLLSS